MRQGKISPSMMCADFAHLDRSVCDLEKAGIEYLHIDIMDGSFVPNFTLGPDFVKALRKMTNIPMDIHMMVNAPERHINLFPLREDDLVSVHAKQRYICNVRFVLYVMPERRRRLHSILLRLSVYWIIFWKMLTWCL